MYISIYIFKYIYTYIHTAYNIYLHTAYIIPCFHILSITMKFFKLIIQESKLRSNFYQMNVPEVNKPNFQEVLAKTNCHDNMYIYMAYAQIRSIDPIRLRYELSPHVVVLDLLGAAWLVHVPDRVAMPGAMPVMPSPSGVPCGKRWRWVKKFWSEQPIPSPSIGRSR